MQLGRHDKKEQTNNRVPHKNIRKWGIYMLRGHCQIQMHTLLKLNLKVALLELASVENV